MTDRLVFPEYVSRSEESLILESASHVVHGSGDARVVLLYGPGGSGKTQLVRHLAGRSSSTSHLRWVEPIDMDDPEFWLLANLEKRIAAALDPENDYFAAYQDDVYSKTRDMGEMTPSDAAVGYLRRVKRQFIECYQAYVDGTGRVPVVSLDTVESVRDTHLLLTLTQWIKALPRTLFILSSRPPGGHPGSPDRLLHELQDPHQSVDVDEIRLEGFSHEAAMSYLGASQVAAVLDHEQRDAVVHLTRGHPLWLALSVEYLQEVGLPEEVQDLSIENIREQLPFGREMTAEGASLHEDVKRRLLTPYRSTDFWHETVKRLAVVRQSLDEDTWRELMSDRELPEGSTWPETWRRLLSIPWIRQRANGRQVTLHDVLAEELVWRIIPLHDQDGSWRSGLWQKAQEIFQRHVDSTAIRSDRHLEELDRRHGGGRPGSVGGDEQSASPASVSAGPQPSLLAEVTELEVTRRTGDQAQASLLHYSVLSGFEPGTRRFLAMFDDASGSNDVFRQELLVLEMQRFLPHHTEDPAPAAPPTDEVRRYQDWLATDAGKPLHLETAMRVASYLTATGQASSALELLRSLPEDVAEPEQRYRLANHLGNACMRVPATVREAEEHFQEALSLVASFSAEERVQRQTEAHKELGFYYRNIGRWKNAEASYRNAVQAMASTMPQRATDHEREEMASVYTNWAYVKALSGGHLEAESLVDTAVKIRRGVGRELGLAISLSVKGEILRYERKYVSAWGAFKEAQDVFQTCGSWYWLGLLYQEQAICLLQASEAGFTLAEDPLREARSRITWALDLCRDQNLRAYPSALNRAGRIFGAVDPAEGLPYLKEGIEQARTLADGWFFCANLVEYAELRYRLWQATGDPGQLDAIRALEPDIELATSEFPFADLEGRWSLMKAYLQVGEGLSSGNTDLIRGAVHLVADGLGLIALSSVGSHGAAALPREFAHLQSVIVMLPPRHREEWYLALRSRWGDPEQGDATLLARLQELYIEL